MDLDRKLKTALDESRLLILGVQVLFGFQFESVFQEVFRDIGPTGQALHGISLLLFLIAASLLIAPSLHHQIVHRGQSTPDAISTASTHAGASLLPLTLGLGVSTYVIFTHTFDRTAGIAVGVAFTVVSLAMLYGLGIFLRGGQGVKPMRQSPAGTPLSTRIDQMLTEARVIIPGGQALLGFQLIATLTEAFAALPTSAKYIHAAGLCAVALAVTLLMTPAAVHRIAYHGEDSEAFFRIGSALVVGATLPLALGISAAVYVVFLKVTNDATVSASVAAVSLAGLFSLWIAFPVARRLAQGRGENHRLAGKTSPL